ncbi:MAG TPA: hypothetical protein VN442_26930 [Bryobacteraceae bacterium]|nr:hypothetical protein [Bryobacteraceae bacterium]
MPRYVVPVLRFMRKSQRVFRGDFLKWTCVECGRFLFMWADSGDPDKCRECGNTHIEGRPWTGRAL